MVKDRNRYVTDLIYTLKMKDNPLKDKSYQFAVRIVKLSQFLQQDKKEYVLNKQILRSIIRKKVSL